MLKKLVAAASFGMSLGVTGVLVYWKLEAPLEVNPGAIVIAVQKLGDTTAIDIPTASYAKTLKHFTIKTRVASKSGYMKETETVQYDPRFSYQFLTYRKLPVGRYEAHVFIGYRLNPLRYDELEVPLAVIQVETP